MASPIEQFKLHPLVSIQVGDIDLSFTNSAAFMGLATGCILLFLTQSMRGRHLIPSRWQSMAELSYEFVANMVRENVGSEGRQYFPLIFTLFMFLMFGNMLGMIPMPGGYTFTSQIVVTFAMAGAIFVGVTVIAICRHGLKFFSFFVPPGAPIYLAPLLVPIEVVSYLMRPVSLSVRLFANMMAGHTMVKVFGLFVVWLGFFGFLPMAMLVALLGFEVLVMVLQAYVFTILSCLYLHDAIHLH